MTVNIQPLGMILGPLLTALGKTMRSKLKEEGINYSMEHLYILRIVRECKESVVQQDLAEFLGKDKSYILRIVDILERDELIRRIVDVNDRRRNILEVTYKGNQLLNRFYEHEMKLSELAYKDISDADIDTFFSVVAKMKLM